MDEKLEYPEIERRQDIFTLAIRQSSEGVAMVDLDGNVLYSNEAFAEMHGYSPKEIFGKNLTIFHTPEQMPGVNAANRQIKEKGSFRGEIWHKRRDGTVFPSVMHNTLVKDDTGRPVAIIASMRDITEQRRTEEALKESEEKYRFLAENVSDMIWIMDMNFNYTYVSPSIKRMLGFTVEEGLARTVEESITPASFNNAMNVFAEELERITKGQASPDRAIKIENELFCKDGSTVWTEAEVKFIYDSNGQPKGVIGATRDITERRKAEAALREEKAFTDTALNAQQDTFFLFELSTGKAIRWNRAFNDITGYTDEEIGGLVAPDSYFSPGDLERTSVCTQTVIEKGHNTIELELICKDGRKVPTEYKVSAIKDEEGTPTYFIIIGRDITDRKKAEMELLEAKSALEEKVKERTAELNEKNVTLKVLLDQRGGESKKLGEQIVANVKKLVMPNINRLKNSTLSSKQQTALTILEANLNEIIAPFSSTVNSKYMALTPTEIQVANHIKHGASSKEISEALALSQRTVDTHRYNIRKKLGISGRGVNLRTYLSSI